MASQTHSGHRSLIPLGQGVYTVPEVCRILQPTMTARKVHYWLDTGLLSPPIVHGSRGEPTLLRFQQLLEIRTVQRLRDELDFSLRKVRESFSWILSNIFGLDWRDLRFERSGGDLVARAGADVMVIPGGQHILDLPPLNKEIAETRNAWESKVFVIPGRPNVVSDTRVLAGAPTIRGTRIETSILAAFATDNELDAAALADVVRLYPDIPPTAIADALVFEGVRLAA